jgi:hypothetical protein
MAIWGYGSPARCCQPAVAGDIIYADLRGELSTHLAPQALFTQSSPVRKPLLQAFPFPSTLGEVTLHQLSHTCVFIYSSRGKWVFPLSCGVFLPSPLLQAFPLLVAGRVPLFLPSLAGLLWGISPPPPLVLRAPHPLCYVSFLLLLIIQFLFFPWWLVCPGGYADLAQGCLWEYHIPLSSPCGLHLPKCSGAGVWWWHQSPPGFSV